MISFNGSSIIMDFHFITNYLSPIFHPNDSFPFTCIIIIGLIGIFNAIFQTWKRQKDRKHQQFVAKLLKSIEESKAKDKSGPRKKAKTPKKQEIPNKVKKAQRKILLQPEIWVDVTHFIPFLDLANGLSLVNSQMHEICATKIYEENKRVVNQIGIEKWEKEPTEDDESDYESFFGNDEESEMSDCWSTEDEEELTGRKEMKKKNTQKNKTKEKEDENALRVKKCVWDSDFSELVEIPLAQVPPPPNILGFRRINIRHLNDQILGFLRLIKPLLESGQDGIFLDVNESGRGRCCGYSPRNNKKEGFRFQKLLDMFKVLQGPVASFSVAEDRLGDPFWKHMRQFFLSLQFLALNGNYFYGTSMAIIVRWLITNRMDAKPRYFYTFWGGQPCVQLIDRLREEFNNAQNASTFIVEFSMNDNVDQEEMQAQPPEPFLLRNELNERLVFGRFRNGSENNLLLRRFPALPTAIGDDWMKPVVNTARKLKCGTPSKASLLWMDANGDLVDGQLNEIKLSLEWPYSPF